MKNKTEEINAVYTHKHTSAVPVLSFKASTQAEFDHARPAADDEAEESFPPYSRDLEVFQGDDAQLEKWEAAYEYLSPAQNGTVMRWKIVDGTGDEHRAYEEQADYPDTEQAARRAFRALASAGSPVWLYSCEDDGEDLSEWELEDMANQPEFEGEDEGEDGPALRPIAAEASPWANDHLQFARLLNELDMAGAFTPEVMALLEESMDASQEKILTIAERATNAFDHYQAQRRLDEQAVLNYRQFADEAADMVAAKKKEPGK